jgi:hypothetical protein
LNPEVLLAGSIGALGVFVLTVLKDLVQGWWRRKRVLKGLLRLVSVEIALHRILVLEDYLQAAETNKPRRLLRTDAWEQARSRIAALLPAHRLASLAEYYANAQRFNVLMDEHTPLKDRAREGPSLADSLANEIGPENRKWMREDYIGAMTTSPGTLEIETSDSSH